MLLKPLYFNVQLDITNSCNLRCTHCYHPHHQNHGALSFQEWIQVIDRVENFSKKTKMQPKLIFCGGEPLTTAYLIPLAREWMRRFPHSHKTILTNGTLLKRRFPIQSGSHTDFALGLKNMGFDFQISIDGPDAERHDLIRGKGNFDRALEGVRRLNEIGASYSILAVLKRSSAQWIDDFFKLAQKENFQSMNFERIVMSGSALNESGNTGGSSESLHGAELKEALEKILACSRKYEVATNTSGALWAAIEEGLGSADSLGFYDWIVSYKGEMKASSRAPFVLGHVLKDDPLKILFQYPLLKKLRHGKIEGCSSCELF